MANPQVVWDEPKIEWDDHADALARNAKPTKFEQDRDPSRQPGFLSSAWDTLKSMPAGALKSIAAGMSMTDPTMDINDRSGSPSLGEQAIEGARQSDESRVARGRSPLYRATAAVGDLAGIDSHGMEDAAEHGSISGVMGHAAGSAVPYLTPAIHSGFEASRGRFPGYVPPEPRPFNFDRAVNRTTLGGAMDLLSPAPTGPKAAMAAGAGLATEAVPWLANKVARSKPVVDFLTKNPGKPSPGAGRVPLWQDAGIEAGQPEPNVQVTHPPEPMARVKRPIAPMPEVETAGDTVSRLAGESKNEVASADTSEPVNAPLDRSKPLPIGDAARDAFSRFVKSKGKEGKEILTGRQPISDNMSHTKPPDPNRALPESRDNDWPPEKWPNYTPDSADQRLDIGKSPLKSLSEDLAENHNYGLDDEDANHDFYSKIDQVAGISPTDPRMGVDLIPSNPALITDASKLLNHFPDNMDHEDVINYTGRLRAGEEPPPIGVIRMGGKMFISDGQHRAAAAARSGLPIEANIKNVDQFERTHPKSSQSRRADRMDDQAVRQEIEQRTQVRPKEPGRKGKAELAEEFKRGQKK